MVLWEDYRLIQLDTGVINTPSRQTLDVTERYTKLKYKSIT